MADDGSESSKSPESDVYTTATTTREEATGVGSYSNGGGRGGGGGHDQYLLPIANVGRIMRRALPPGAKISREARETMQECASEFVAFVTGEAADRCRRERRKTVGGDDVCRALGALGLDGYAASMRRYLGRYREHEEGRAAAWGWNRAGLVGESENDGSHGDQEEEEEFPIFRRAQVRSSSSGPAATLIFDVMERGGSASRRS